MVKTKREASVQGIKKFYFLFHSPRHKKALFLIPVRLTEILAKYIPWGDVKKIIDRFGCYMPSIGEVPYNNYHFCFASIRSRSLQRFFEIRVFYPDQGLSKVNTQ